MQIVLASGSPRRLELLHQIGLKPLVMVSNYHETESGLAPEVLVSTNALGKARSVLAQCSDEVVVIAADTVVVLEGEIWVSREIVRRRKICFAL